MKKSFFDFTINAYLLFLDFLSDYKFYPFVSCPIKSSEKWAILRHDVDSLPKNALLFAQIQTQLGVCGTYFFRIVPDSFNPQVIQKIAHLGHEIGYHYEDVNLAATAMKNDKLRINKSAKYIEELLEKAIESFTTNLSILRKYADIRTICMHGSPFSPWDSRLLWSKYDYRDFGLIGEPYFDIDFQEIAYYTDTGRRWDGEAMNLRDKPMAVVRGQSSGDTGQRFPRFHSTFEIIEAANKGELPQKIMFTFHPQRWTNNSVLWLKELALQNAKNVVKRYWLVPRNEQSLLT